MHQVLTADGAEFRADEDPSATFGFAFHVTAFGADHFSGPRVQAGEVNLVFLTSLLDSRHFEVIQNHGHKVAAVLTGTGCCRIKQFAVRADAQHAMRREAFHGERACYTDFFLVLIGLIIQIFVVRLGCDGGINFLLAGDTRLPPVGVQLQCLLVPCRIRFAGDFPLFPLFAEKFIQLYTQGFHCLLPLVVNNINFGIVGDRFQRDMWHALVDEPQIDIIEGGSRGSRTVVQFRFFGLPVLAVGHEIIGIACAHNASTSQRQRHAGGIYSDPAAAPLFGNVSCRAGTTGGVKHEVAGVGRH